MDWRFNTVWFDQLPKSMVRVSVPTPGKHATVGDSLAGGQYLNVWRFNSEPKSFEDFPARKTVKYLELTHSNITSFKGVSTLGRVKRLELRHCLKLESDHGLSELADSLEWLHINQSRRFRFGKELLGLSKLRVLCLNSCGPLRDLEFLDRFPLLKDFRFVDTTVVNGDLSPILRHPSLCTVGFLDKRHYNMKSAEVEARLAGCTAKTVVFAYKGSCVTFRYKGMRA